MMASDPGRANALVAELVGPSDESADRAVAILHAHAAALAWVRDTTGSYPAPTSVAAALNDAAASLRAADDQRDHEAELAGRLERPVAVSRPGRRRSASGPSGGSAWSATHAASHALLTGLPILTSDPTRYATVPVNLLSL